MKADFGYVFRRIHDSHVMGSVVELGVDYSTGAPRQDLPEYYEQVPAEYDDPSLFVPVFVVFSRLEAKGKLDSAWALLDDSQKRQIASLEFGLHPDDPSVRGLIEAVGEDPDEILKPE